MKALEYELKNIKDRFTYAFNRLKEYCKEEKDYHKGLNKIIGRLLTTREMMWVLGWGHKYGYYNSFGSVETPLERLEFLSFFVGHELLDDGDPCVGWYKHRLGRISSDDEHMIECLETDKGAKPFLHSCREMLPGTKSLQTSINFEDVVWVLDWHEKSAERFIKNVNKFAGRSETREPENPMLVELALELGCQL